MSITGRVNVDALIHDKTDANIKVIDVESHTTATGAKVAVVEGTATAEGVDIDPTSPGYTDAGGNAVTFSSVSLLVVTGSNALTLDAGDVKTKAAAGKCAVTATPGHSTGTITITGSGSFRLVIVGA